MNASLSLRAEPDLEPVSGAVLQASPGHMSEVQPLRPHPGLLSWNLHPNGSPWATQMHMRAGEGRLWRHSSCSRGWSQQFGSEPLPSPFLGACHWCSDEAAAGPSLYSFPVTSSSSAPSLSPAGDGFAKLCEGGTEESSWERVADL